jgi:alpha-2-macroglobulin
MSAHRISKKTLCCIAISLFLAGTGYNKLAPGYQGAAGGAFPPNAQARYIGTFDLAKFPPHAPFTLQFKKPIDPASSAIPLMSFPYAEGKSSWSSDSTVLTFQPDGALQSGATYTFFLDPGMRMAGEGESLDQALQWTVQVDKGPTIASITPSPSVLANRKLDRITLTFDRDMDRGSTGKALSVQPSLPFTMEWTDDRTLKIRPLEPLQADNRYDFMLSGSGSDVAASAKDGTVMADDYVWSYWLDPLKAAVTTKNNKSVEVEFNYPLDQKATGTPFGITPALAGEWTWADERTARFQATDPIPSGRRFSIAFTGPLMDAFGPIQPEAAGYSFSAPPPVRILTDPDGNEGSIPVDFPAFRVFFDVAVDHRSAEAAFSLSPAVSGYFVWGGDPAANGSETLEYHPDRLLDEGTIYTLTISAAVLGSKGQPILVDPVSATFQTNMYYNWGISPTFGVGSDVQVVDAAGARKVQFGARGGETVQFELYPYKPVDFVRLYTGKYGDNGLRFTTTLMPVPAKGQSPAAVWRYMAPDSQGSPVLETAIPADIIPGLYVLNMLHDGRLYDQLFVALSNNTLVLKRSGANLFVWLSNINGASVPGAEISLYSSRGEIVNQGLTDRNGVYTIVLPDDVAPMLVTARRHEAGGDDITISGLDWQYQTVFPNYWSQNNAPVHRDYMTYIYTERPIYRPGQTVYFKAVVRKDNDAAYRLLPAGTPVVVNVRDGRNNLVQTFGLKANEFGSVDGSFRLEDEAVLGEYTIEAIVNGESQTQNFLVQDYRKPDYSVTLRAVDADPARKIVAGDTVQLEAEAKFYFGQPVAGASVTTAAFYLRTSYDYSWQSDLWGSFVSWYPASYLNFESGSQTDSQGKVAITVHTSGFSSDDAQHQWRSSVESLTYALQVTVDDGSHQTISASYIITVYSASEVLTIDGGGYIQKPGEPFTVRAAAETLAGGPVAGRDLTLALDQWDHTTADFNAKAPYTLTTDSAGRAARELTLGSGYYELELSGKDAGGRPMAVSTWVCVFSSADEWFVRTKNEITIAADKDSYQPGQRARFMIESTFSGPALLTFERGHVLRSVPVELTAPLTVVETTMTAADAPNVFVTINAWQPSKVTPSDDYDWEYWGSNRPESYLRLATVEVAVDAGAKQLQVAISTDRKEYAPGGPMQVTIDVSDAGGNPVPAEVSLAVVDESVFSLSEEQSPDIFTAFYGTRERSIRTYDSMSPDRIIMEQGGRGGGGGGGPDTGTNMRSDFQDTAAWLPALRTDARGHLTVTVTLPDNLTSWRLTAKAISKDSLVGQSHINVETTKDLLIRPSLPRVLTTGDQAVITAFVHNYGKEKRTLTVSFEARGLRFLDGSERTVTLDPGQVLPVSWSVIVEGVQPTEAVFRAVEKGGASDAIRLPLAIQPAATTSVYSDSGEFTDHTRIVLPLPKVVPQTSLVTLRLSRSMSGSILGGLDYLTGYPYGCIEQTMSRALPNAVVGRAQALLGLGDPGMQARLDPLIRASLQRLVNFQHTDGGWGWWYDDASTDYQTAWVLFGLAQISDAGYPVNAKIIADGVRYLTADLADMDIRTRAFALYSMALNGRGDPAATRALGQDSLNELDPFSQAGLALALQKIGDAEGARAVLAAIGKHAVQNKTLAYWPQKSSDGTYNRKTMASTIRTTALILDAYLAIDPGNELIPAMVRYLLFQRHGNYGWGTTNETSFSILSLTDYLVRQAQKSGETFFQVNLNDHPLSNGTLRTGKNSAIINIPVDLLNVGANTLTVSASGGAKLYYDLSARYSVLETSSAPAGPIKVTRRYLDPQSGNPLTAISAGQLVKVELTATVGADASYMMIEDHLPGGLEPLNENLNTTPFFTGNTDYDSYYDPYSWDTLGYNYKDIRADRVGFFITEFGSGRHMFTYMARAVSGGTFLALPVQAYAMYDSSVWGRSGSDTFVVK